MKPGVGGLWAAVLTAGLVASAGCGKGAKGDCGPIVACGGDPSNGGSATWGLADSNGVCQYLPARPAQPLDVIDFEGQTPPRPPQIAPPQPSPVVTQQTTSGDWCSTLVVTGSGADTMVGNVNLWHQAPQLVTGKLPDGTYASSMKFFKDDHSYVTTLRLADRNMTHFAPVCLLASGGNPSCADLKTALTTFYKPANASPPTFDDFACALASDNGCDCTYVYQVLVSDTGKWTVLDDGQTMLQESTQYLYGGFPVASQSPGTTFQTRFCASGGYLDVSGDRGSALAGVQGLRNLSLVLMP
ncbi:MAG: hypothetical protein JWM82_4295 [Myxococcales bacterium]|nr:hypothetical protein [Myxococcales bacterium]